MTGPERPAGRRPDPLTGPPPTADPERVLAQALRAMAGGPRGEQPGPAGTLPPAPGGGDDRRGWTSVQVVLLAALIGLTLGVVAGLLTLMLQ